MSEPRSWWIHMAYKDVGTTNWTVRQQHEKPPKPTAYENDWIEVVEAKAFDQLKAELRETKDTILVISNGAIKLSDKRDELQAELTAAREQCEKLLEYLKDVIRNSSDILAKKHCSNGLAEHETWLKEQK